MDYLKTTSKYEWQSVGFLTDGALILICLNPFFHLQGIRKAKGWSGLVNS